MVERRKRESKPRKRNLIVKSYTVRPDQAQYIEDSTASRKAASRWIRDAIDMRMEKELEGLVSPVPQKIPIEENPDSGE